MPSIRLCTLALAALLAAGAAPSASAQSLRELYEAARGYDATYLAARAQAQSAEFRTAQAEALARPSLALTGSATLSQLDPPSLPAGDSNSVQAALSGYSDMPMRRLARDYGCPYTINEVVLDKAYSENWILITNDKDFGEKIYRDKRPHHGVIFLRLQDERAVSKIDAIEKLLDRYEDQLAGAFVVVSETQVRFGHT